MILKRAGSQPSIKGPEAYFTGTIRMDPLNSPPEPARASIVSVSVSERRSPGGMI